MSSNSQFDSGVTMEELRRVGEYALLDMRPAGAREYGMIPGALPYERNYAAGITAKGVKAVLYCHRGDKSKAEAESLIKEGVKAYYLKGGYMRWLQDAMSAADDGEICKRAEESIRKKFRTVLMSRFIKAIKTYRLLSPGDKVAVCISGGKDSMLMAKLFQELLRYSEFEFGLEFLVMDPGYNAENRVAIESNARRLNVPVKIFETDIFSAVYHIEKSPCYLLSLIHI